MKAMMGLKPSALMIAIGLGAVGDLGNVSDYAQLGALGILALYFLVIDPKKSREARNAHAEQSKAEREARRDELRMMIDALTSNKEKK